MANAQKDLPVPGAQYQQLDARASLPFGTDAFDLIISSMMFNELSDGAMKRALAECHRVLSAQGRLLITVLHPTFVRHLDKEGQIRSEESGLHSMKSGYGVRLPIVKRSRRRYKQLIAAAGFEFAIIELKPTAKLIKARPGYKVARQIPIALVFDCQPAP